MTIKLVVIQSEDPQQDPNRALVLVPADFDVDDLLDDDRITQQIDAPAIIGYANLDNPTLSDLVSNVGLNTPYFD